MRSIGRYMLDEEIGRGSMGAVFRASHPLIERGVANYLLGQPSKFLALAGRG